MRKGNTPMRMGKGNMGMGEGNIGIVTGNPGVFQGYSYPYPSIPLPFVAGLGFNRLGSGVMRVQRVQKPAGGLASTWFFSMEHDGYICK
jgi:hypothetical protein